MGHAWVTKDVLDQKCVNGYIDKILNFIKSAQVLFVEIKIFRDQDENPQGPKHKNHVSLCIQH